MNQVHATPEEARAAWTTQRNTWSRNHRKAMSALRTRHIHEYDQLMAAAKRGEL